MTTTDTHPGVDTVRAALALAIRAPSVHNTQPWQWRVGDRTVHLYADEERRLSCADPDGRDQIISCGVALHHFRIAARSMGWRTIVHRFPNPAEPNHLAAVEFARVTPTADFVELARAINRRHTDRRRVTSWEIPPGQLATLLAAGTEEGADIREIVGGANRAALVAAFAWAAEQHRGDPDYRSELAMWSGRHAAPDGVPARNAVPVAEDPLTREFAVATQSETVVRDMTEGGSLLLVYTPVDDRLSWLRAGEASSAVLLSATALGMATCPMSEPLELPRTRDLIRGDVLDDIGYPQLIIRVGWAATSADEVPVSPRRPLDEVVSPLR
ncbi:Acg family FMN-binding oxidoreductase [Nocardia paucivorans]|uniref:Acg family FMN-binding oxidoreductase n=1 Tax=Nocardia paucivorans TaxID=114259 RepID=UPI0002FDC950|nr:nitroreductase family protein [Nocardia paucivorans]